MEEIKEDLSNLSDQITEVVDSGLDLLKGKQKFSSSAISSNSSKLLFNVAQLASLRSNLEDFLIQATSFERVLYNQLMESFGKDMKLTDKRNAIEAEPNYIEAREFLESIQSKITYVKTMIEVFNNGHIFFRQLMREDT